MNKTTKQKLLIFLMITIVILILIAGSLKNITFKPGIPLPEIKQGKESSIIVSPKTGSSISVNGFLNVIIIILFLTCVVLGLFQMIKYFKIKKLGIAVFYILLCTISLTGILLLIIYILPHTGSTINPDLNFIKQLDPLKSPLGKVPVIILWFLGLIIILLIIFLLYKIITSKKKANDTFYQIELEAFKARNALLNGQNLKDVIIHCYKQMCIALEKDNKIQREESMTVEEFECKLEDAGAPMESVRELTRLFETVRYGNWLPQSGEEKKAIKCFETIIEHFRIMNERKSNDKI